MPEDSGVTQVVQAPPQEPYRPQASQTRRRADGRPDTRQARRTALPLAIGAVAAAAIAGVAVAVSLGAGPFSTSSSTADAQGTTSTTQATQNTTDDTTNEGAETSAAANTTTGADANTSSSSSTSDTDATSANANSSSADSSGTNATDTSDAGQDSSSEASGSAQDGSVTLSGGYVSGPGYSLSVPSTFQVQSSDAAGNATLVDTASNCVITISVNDNPAGETADTALAEASAGATSSAYTAEGSDWYVISDEPNGTVYYVMAYVEPSRIVSLRFDYSQADKTQCDPIIESVQPTFRVS